MSFEPNLNHCNLFQELCGPGMVPPVAYADFKDKAKVKAKLDGQKMVVTSGKEDMDNSGTGENGFI